MEQPIHGNYHSYHSTRFANPTSVDPRVSLFPFEFFKGKRVLDVGCNEGWLTVDIAQRLNPARIIGVDIDAALIRAAWKRRRFVWSLQRPIAKNNRGASLPLSESEQTGDSKRYKKRKRTESQAEVLNEAADSSAIDPDSVTYFPLSMEHMFGPMPIPPPKTVGIQGQALFPHNITFYTADWTTNSTSTAVGDQEGTIGGIEKEDKEGYDIVLALSITKWIHLNGGDAGLISFFRKIHTVLRSGGLLLLEPQDWEGYAKARKMTPTLAENYKGLQLRPSDFDRVLKEIGFIETGVLATSGEGGYKRSVLSYSKSS